MFILNRATSVARLLSFAVAVATGLLFIPLAAWSQALSYINGTVTADGAPVEGAAVVLTGNNLTLRRTTDARGAFSFPGVNIGQYELRASKGGGSAASGIQLSAAGVTGSLALGDTLRTIGKTVTVRSPVNRTSGTDVTGYVRVAAEASQPDQHAEYSLAVAGRGARLQRPSPRRRRS